MYDFQYMILVKMSYLTHSVLYILYYIYFYLYNIIYIVDILLE